MTDVEFFTARDGIELAYQEMGEGSPLILVHGLFSNATMNWVKFGTAQQLVDAGYRVVLPDLRAHGRSGAPQEEQFYGPDVLAEDLEDLIAHLGLSEFDLGGFSLGSRTSVRAVVRGLKPRRLILGGMGLAGLAGWTRRSDFFKRVIADYETAKRGDDTWLSVQFMKSMKIDRIAAGHLLDTFTDTQPEALAAITMPTLIVCGEQDQDNGNAAELAELLANAELATIPGTHMSSVTMPELGQAIVQFLEPSSAA
jgi:pimeloyl-ACP methyl ester carboxylesterase